jgi:hypothetical protein
MENFIVNEFIEERKPSATAYEFDSFKKAEEFAKTYKNGIYSNCYKHEPSYPYLWIRAERITDAGRELPFSYCYFAE